MKRKRRTDINIYTEVIYVYIHTIVYTHEQSPTIITVIPQLKKRRRKLVVLKETKIRQH